VFENGQEHLVKGFKITSSIFDETTIEDGVTKWNICCYGHMTIENDVATIR
jgi:hypothetical protein